MGSGDRPDLAAVLNAFGLDVFSEPVQIVPLSRVEASEAAAPYESGFLPVSPLLPLVVLIPEDSDVAPLVRLLARSHSDDTRYRAYSGDGVSELSLADLGNDGRLVAVYAPPVDPLANGTDPRAMQQITARLRRPDGCPWDRKQTSQSLAKNFVDEVYEVVDAIESGEPAAISEELGDLVLLIMMQAQIAHESGEFSIEDVYEGIAHKIVGRHPHVFGEAVVESDADLSGVWAEAKAREVAEGCKHGGKDIDGEPFSMPALARAARVLKKHPLGQDEDAPPLLRLVNDLIAAGSDPDAILKEQLRKHVSRLQQRS